MKITLLTTALLLASTLSTACTQESTYDLNPRFENPTDYEPAQVADWPHALFCFDGQRCTDVVASENRASLGKINTNSHLATMVAYSSSENLRFGNLRSGANAYDYTIAIEDANAEIPEVWIECKSLRADKQSFNLKPLTSQVKVNLNGASANLSSVYLEFPHMADLLYLKSGVAEPLKQAKTKSVSLDSKGGSFNLFPMATGTDKWLLKFTLNFTDQRQGELSFEGELALPHSIKAGESWELDFDFEELQDPSVYKVSCRKAAFGVVDAPTIASNVYYMAKTDNTYRDQNEYYNVYVLQNSVWKSIKVSNALCSNSVAHHENIWNDWDNSKKLRDTMSYALFTDDFNGPVRVRVEKRKGYKTVQVRPSTHNIEITETGGNAIEFTLPSWEKRKVSVEFDGDRYHNLFLMPARKDANAPSASSGNVIYYGPGEHVADRINLTEGQTLYLDEGAVLYPQQINIKGNDITIAGRGVISGEKMRHWGDIYSNGDVMIDMMGNGVPGGYKNFTIEGVTIIDAPSWCLRIFNTDNVRIEGINMIHWILNGDGIDLLSVTNATINDCMLRAYDDCITLKIRHTASPMSQVDNIRISNCVLWADYARAVVVGPEGGDWTIGTGGISNVQIENCVVLEAARGQALAIMQELQTGIFWGAPAKFSDITFSDCVVDNIHPSGYPIYIYQLSGSNVCEMDKISFRNIRIIDSRGGIASLIKTGPNYIANLLFENLTFNSKKITSMGTHIEIDQPSDDQHVYYEFK